MFERILWFVVAVVLAAMAVSLWVDAWVAALGAGALAAYAAISALRGRCFGDVCAPSFTGTGTVSGTEPAETQREPGRE